MTVLGATTRSQQTLFLCGTPVHESRVARIVATCLPCQVHTRSIFMTRCTTHSVDRKWDARASMQPYAGRSCFTLHTWSNTRVSDSRATSSTSMITDGEEEGVSLGTMEFSGDVDLKLFQSLLFQWANNLTQNANIPLPAPLKVDKTEEGLRLSYIRVKDGAVENLVTIGISVTPGVGGGPSLFRAVRSGPMKAKALPGEAEIMLSLKAALIKSLAVCRRG